MITGILLAAMLNIGAVADSVQTEKYFRAPSDSNCSVELTVEWPTKGPEAVVKAAREYISQEAVAFFPERYEGTTHSVEYSGDMTDGKAMTDFYADSLLADQQSLYKQLRDSGATQGFFINRSKIYVQSQTDSTITYEADSYSFEGGAHGSYWLEGTTFRKSDGSTVDIELDPMKVDDMQPLLREGINTYLKKNGSDLTVDSIIDGGMFLTDGVIPLPSTLPYLTSDGVKFVYQQYEIVPYALGTPTFTIPLEKLKPFFDK